MRPWEAGTTSTSWTKTYCLRQVNILSASEQVEPWRVKKNIRMRHLYLKLEDRVTQVVMYQHQH